MSHQESQKLPLLPLQGELPPYYPLDELDDELYTDILLYNQGWNTPPWALRLGSFAKRTSTRLVSTLVILPLIASIAAHIYFQMFSTLHIFLAVAWIGLPVATIVAIASLIAKIPTKTITSRDQLKALILLTFLCTVTWRTFTVSSRRGLSDRPYQLPANQAYFIAVDLYNSEHLFPAFTDSLLDVVDRLGEQNVYISIYESNSKDHTKQHLSLLERQLNQHHIQNRVRMLDNSRREDLERIERLAMVRNEALSPIHEGIYGVNNRTFTKLLWLNDIFFRPESVLEMITTNKGQFDQVCALDYLPLGFYDTWVMRDVDALRPTPLWPYFKRQQDIDSLRRGDVIPVNSCWNGMTVFDAKWFLPDTNNSTHTPGIDDGPIRFRTHPDCLVSECLLPSYDIHVRSKQRPLIFVNPRAVATYQARDYLMYDWIMRSNIVNLWARVWQDFVSHSLFGFFIEIGRKEAACAEALRSGWKPLLDTLSF